MIRFKKKIPSFLFYDYETFGMHASLDKPAQFACIRTDLNFKIIDDPQCFYCFPSDDYLPNPLSVLITHITPQYTQKYGTNEYYFSKKIHDILTVSNTCVIGYNNINFDDEFTRNIFYRNFFDPYEWSWKNGNSRWDLLDLLRACYALRPDGIKWPKNKLGLPSFKLSDLTEINNIVHEDVYATIEIAKIVKKKQPKLFDFFFKNRRKKELCKLINLKIFKPIIYVSHSFGAIRKNISCILPIAWHENNSNILISVDLFKDFEKLIALFKKTSFHDISIKNLFNLGIVLLYLNRCPMLAPMKVIRQKDYDRLNFHNYLDRNKIESLKEDKFIKKIIKIFSKKNDLNTSVNVDLQIYNSFFNLHDKRIIKIIRNTDPSALKNVTFSFYDPRLKILFFRYRARNFFYTLDNHEKKIWLKYCLKILNLSSLVEFKNKIKFLSEQYSFDKEKIILLNNLLDYALQKYKKILHEKTNLN